MLLPLAPLAPLALRRFARSSSCRSDRARLQYAAHMTHRDAQARVGHASRHLLGLREGRRGGGGGQWRSVAAAGGVFAP